jgi:glycosyltransferase involved in cell wall biosynthesis
MPATLLSKEQPTPARPEIVPAPGLRRRERMKLALKLFKLRFTEHLMHEAPLFKKCMGLFGYLAARVLGLAGNRRRAFLLLTKLHRADLVVLANGRAEQEAREAAAHAAHGVDHPLLTLYRDHIDHLKPTPGTAKSFEDPKGLLGPLVKVIKSAAAGEKGVLLLQYSSIFPLFAKRFDIHQIAARYHIVLEPDWSGYCDANILSYSQFPFPVFVQAFEPRDAEFIRNLRSNLVVVPTSTNWWVDHRLFRPLAGVEKDMDVVMVAGWGEYKRHHRFFAALGHLRRAGHQLRVLLLGYPAGLTRQDIVQQAKFYGVADQLEIHESVAYRQVNELVNRAKVNVIWSRKEGVNRAIIEGMFAGLPCLVREGFNYGYRYPYINNQTGCFVRERDLPARLLWMVNNAHRFSPREWVLANMSCQRSTSLLSETIGKTAAERGESWHEPVAVKVNWLSSMQYWDSQDASRFEADYAFLRHALRPAN